MQIDFYRRISQDPVAYLSCRSLHLLLPFESGYDFCSSRESKDYPVEDTFRPWILQHYGLLSDGFESMNAMSVLRHVVQDEGRAFDNFFEHLEQVLAEHPEIFETPRRFPGRNVDHISVSKLLDFLSKPGLYRVDSLPTLRAFLDGARLAFLDEGRDDLCDLDGFDEWVRCALKIEGLERWEEMLGGYLAGKLEPNAQVKWTIRQMQTYRACVLPETLVLAPVESPRTGLEVWSTIDFLVMFLSADSPIPYWSDFGVPLTEAKQIELQQGCRKIVEGFTLGASSYSSVDLSKARKQMTLDSLLALVTACGVEKQVITTIEQWGHLPFHDAGRLDIPSQISGSLGRNPTKGPAISDTICTAVRAVEQGYSVGFALTSLHSTVPRRWVPSPWDAFLEGLFPSPGVLVWTACSIVWRIRRKNFWPDLRQMLTDHQIDELLEWHHALVAEANGYEFPDLVEQKTEWGPPSLPFRKPTRW